MGTRGNGLDFEGLSQQLLRRAPEFLSFWLPGGTIKGSEFSCGDLKGGPGQSLKININSGLWKDFAADVKGADLIDLYAAINGLELGEAAKKLAAEIGFALTPLKIKAASESKDLIAPPPKAPAPNFEHFKYGKPTKTWTYKAIDGSPLFYVSRYDLADGRKEFLPLAWSQTGKWVNKIFPAPRPMYGLELLNARPDAPILLCEGEKACDAARTLLGKAYIVMSWPGGGNAVGKIDWSPIYKRKVLIWPDADSGHTYHKGHPKEGQVKPYAEQPGQAAALQIARALLGNVQEVKIIMTNKENGWDAADAVKEGHTYDSIVEWARPLAVPINAPKPMAEVMPEDPGHADDVTPNQSLQTIYNQCEVSTTDKGSPHNNMQNVVKLLMGLPYFKNKIWFDEFHNKIFTTRGSNGHTIVREWADYDTLALMEIFQGSLGMYRLSKQNVEDAILSYARRDIRNEPKDWMNTLKWDGEPRINDFFVDIFGAEASEYTSAASKNWWISMVARIYDPGCKVDNMVILEGGQGKFKSTALDIVGGKWFAEATESIMSKDFYMTLHGTLLIEIGELQGFNKAETSSIKKIITCRKDRYRPPYGRAAATFPRQCIFVGTTNEDAYLRDATGGRRFWPIKIGAIKLDLIRFGRDQYFAEAIARYKANETWWEMPESTAEIQESRRQVDPWEEPIRDYLEGKPTNGMFPSAKRNEVTINEIAEHCLRIELGRLDKQHQMRIASILKCYHLRKTVLRRGGNIVKVWIRDADAPEIGKFNV